MTEQRDPRTKLLAEAIHEDWPEGATALFAQRAATVARRRRVRHSLVAAGAMAAVAVLLILSLVRPAPVRDRPSPVKAAMPTYEIISDEELLAQFPGRPLLMVDKGNGTRELILLDGTPTESGVK